MLYVHLIAYLLLGLLIYPLVPTGTLRFFLSAVYMLFFVLDIAAIYAKGTHFSLSFAANIERKVIEMALTSFLPVTIAVSLLYVVLLVVIHSYDAQIIAFTSQEIFPHVTIIAIILLLGFSKNGVFFNVVMTMKGLLSSNHATTLQDISEDLDFSANYVRAGDVVATQGKNVVMIYLESFDQNFLNDQIFPGLMPRLKQRIERWTYYEHYIPYKGIDYTMGALYGTQTGLPNYFGLQGNNVFADITGSQTASIGNILKKAGYNEVYMNGGDLAFAGKGNFFEKNGYSTLGNPNYDESFTRSEWGIHDEDLLNEAKKVYLELSKEEKPFNLTLLTLDLHFPDGLENPKDKGKYNEGHGILNAAAALDVALDEFLNFLEAQPNAEDTVIYITGDHPLMGINSVTSRLGKQERNLFLLTNAKPSPSYPKTQESIYFYDLPKLILEGMEVQHNAKFLPDLIPDLSYAYIDKHIGAFTTLNYLLHQFSRIHDDLYVVKDNSRYVLRSGKQTIKSFHLEDNEFLFFVLDEKLDIIGSFRMERTYEHLQIDPSYQGNLLLGFYLEQNEVYGIIMDQNGEIYQNFKASEEVSPRKLHSYMKALHKEVKHA